MAALNLVKGGQAGAAPGLAAASAGGDSFPIISRTQKFHFKNTDAAARNVTFVAQTKCNEGVLHNVIVNVPAGTERIVDDIDPQFFGDANGRVQLTYDASANLTVGSYA